MAYDSAGYRNHCSKCRHFWPDADGTALRREVFGRHMPETHRCDKWGVRVDPWDSPQSPISVAAGCIFYERGGRNG